MQAMIEFQFDSKQPLHERGRVVMEMVRAIPKGGEGEICINCGDMGNNHSCCHYRDTVTRITDVDLDVMYMDYLTTTSGTWEYNAFDVFSVRAGVSTQVIGNCNHEEGDFIAAVHNAFPALHAEIMALRRILSTTTGA